MARNLLYAAVHGKRQTMSRMTPAEDRLNASIIRVCFIVLVVLLLGKVFG